MNRHLNHIIRFTLLYLFTSLIVLNACSQDSTSYDTTVHIIQIPSAIDSINNQAEVPHFDDIRTVPMIHDRHLPDTVISHIKKQEDYWYADSSIGNKAPLNTQQKEKQNNSDDSILNKEWFRSFIWILIIICFIAVVISYLSSGNIFVFRKKARKIPGANKAEEYDDIYSMDFESAIASAISNRQFRLATRLLYLATLKDLSERNLIDYRQESTNSEYLLQLGNSPYYNRFLRLTRNFEYTWYGKFELSQESFMKIYDEFSTFKKEIGQ
jgi:hypothetical protein